MLPSHIYHADWGTAANKRWLARAVLGPNGGYTAFAPEPIPNHFDLIPLIRREIGDDCALLGFDFPIGLPAAYARVAGVTAFKPFLQTISAEDPPSFYNVAKDRSEISVRRPFYPFSPGGRKQVHLLDALGVGHIDDLRRRCDKKQRSRRAACPLFWTLGANQVGKGAIVGWRDVLVPALRDDKCVSLWPFDGGLNELLKPRQIVIVETYPAEYYRWFLSEPLLGKGKQEVRKKVSGPLIKRLETTGTKLDRKTFQVVQEGFPQGGDDAFDAAVGLFGMIEVATGKRQSGEPTEGEIRNLEGWIFGQSFCEESQRV